MTELKKKFRQCLHWIFRGNPQSLWRRYALGFALIFVTISASHWASLETIKAAEDDAQVLSVSNRQRMLSQRILFLMAETKHDHDPYVAQRLESALVLFETSHNWLVSRNNLSPALRHLYFEKKPISLDAFSRRFIQMIGVVSNAVGEQEEQLHEIVTQWGKEDLIFSLATAAYLFRQESEARIARLQQIQQITLFTALVVLLLEALLIFLPAQLLVNDTIRRLERRKLLLKKSLGKLNARNKELLCARQRLTQAANHDALTGLLNRRAIYEHLNTYVTSDQGADFTRCVMKIDLDLFKQINDTLGHDAGDQVLVHVAEILTAEARDQDFIGRIGGDEFVILLDDPLSLSSVEDLANRIIASICKPVTIDNKQCSVGASAGYTMAVSSAATPDQLLIESDLALYEAKRAGRGLAFAYSDALATEIETRRMLFNEITDALSEDQFVPYLQPQVYSGTGEIYGCEVLARWLHPKRGLIPPATFIAAAEEAGLVDQIDRIMVEKGLDILEDLQARGFELPSISVNASPSTLRDPHLVDRLMQEVLGRHLNPSQLTVEVLESTLIENEDDIAVSTIERLSNAGFAVVLDDFGTGYASMSNLSRLQFDGIKLDQSLVRPVPDGRANSIISALVALSHNLNMKVVAEGVETKAQLQTVEHLGCDIVQGFGIGVPMAKEDFEIWYNSYNSQDIAARKQS